MGVGVTCVTSKLLEFFIRDIVVKHMTDNGLYSECQHGFRKHISCITQVLLVIEDLTKFTEVGHPIDIAYLDFKKAFDSVPHQKLLSKLAAYGITGNIFKWIKGFLTNRHPRARVGNHYSPMTEVLSGILQGSVLGPILFTIFINDFFYKRLARLCSKLL